MITAVIIVIVLIAIIIMGLWLKMEGQLWPHRSTLDFWNLSNLPFIKKLEGYIYAARADLYLKPATWPWFMRRFVTNESADNYHGKMLTHSDAAKLVAVDHPVILKDMDQVIPYPVAKSIILQDPLPSLAVMECPCRVQNKTGCQPRDVCLVVGEPYASFIVDHRPDKARRITVAEALDIIAAEEERGHIHTAWFKDVMHNRFYCICNCCTCCCLGMQSYLRGVPRLTHSGYSPRFAYDDCINCSICVSTCPFHAITLPDGLPVLDEDLCMGCGLCCSHCPNDAVELVLSPHKGVPLDWELLLP